MLPGIQLPDLQIEFVYQTLSEVYDWGLKDLNVPEIHKQTLGEGVKVCVIDSGCSEHFEVENNVVNSENFTKSRTNKDRYGHATFIGGIIASEKNDEGVIGVAPKAQLYFAKAIDDGGAGSPAALVNSVKWAVRQGVDIISISAGSFFDFKPLHQAIREAYKKNIIVVAAAGNSGTRHYDVAFPARYPEAIGVAAYNKAHHAARFSSRGINVFCAMPGVDIYSTWLDNSFCKSKGTCLTGDILVYSSFGPVPISKVDVGFRVWSYDSKQNQFSWKTVTHTWEHEKQGILEIKTKHSSIKCTKDHLILVARRGSKNARWTPAGECSVQDRIISSPVVRNNLPQRQIMPRDNWSVKWCGNGFHSDLDIDGISKSSVWGFCNGKHGIRYKYAEKIIEHYNLPLSKLSFGQGKKHPKIILPQLDSNLAYLCGFFLGDGWITSATRARRVYFAKCNLDFVNKKLLQTFNKVFGQELVENNNNQYMCGNSVIADIFADLCGIAKAKEKTIPLLWYTENTLLQTSFLAGLCDADGCIENNRIRLYSSSQSLIERAASLCDYAGVTRNRVNVRTRRIKAPNSRSKIESTEYSLLMDLLPFSSKSEQMDDNLKFWNMFEDVSSSYITSIRQLDDEKVYDITVEGNHNFVANNMIVHNSYACPILAGICALILAQHRKVRNPKTPCETPRQMMEHLKKYSRKLSDLDKRAVGFGTIDLEQMFKES